MHGTADCSHFRPWLSTHLPRSIGLSSPSRQENKGCSNADSFHAHLVIALDSSINLVCSLVYGVILRLQREILQLRLNFLKTRKVFRINTTGFNSDQLEC